MASVWTALCMAFSLFAVSSGKPFHTSHDQTLNPRQASTTGVTSFNNPPYQLFSILSTPTTIRFLFKDPNPNAPVPDGGPGTPVVCAASFAASDGQTGSSNVPDEPRSCVDSVTGNPESTSQYSWQVTNYTSPGVFSVKIWHGYIIKDVGPCAVQEDGTETFCNTVFYGEHEIDASKGDVTCDTVTMSCTSKGIIEVPITSAVA